MEPRPCPNYNQLASNEELLAATGTGLGVTTTEGSDCSFEKCNYGSSRG